jgi:hypothetical protein
MARVALLIGTEHYGKEFKQLEATPRNVHGLAEVLEHPEMGQFESVEVLIDPDHSRMGETIETWLSERDKDDFVLLYISGHGVKDVKRKLYFAASKTVKNKQGELVTSTAVSARNVHDWLQASKAKRQIVILDCCFSGAFGDLLAQDDGAVDVEGALGAEGRVVLTSSSSMQYSFQQREGSLSVYTHHLIEGITSGAADDDDDGKISTDELHGYVKRKVQDESPGMTPQMIVTKDAGYRLRIANALLGDPKVQYRKEVEKIVEEDGGEICIDFSRPFLEELRQKLGISLEIATEIEDAVLEPILQYQSKLKRYKNVVNNAVFKGKFPFGDRESKRLIQLQRTLGLSDEDTTNIIQSAVANVVVELIPTPEVVISATPKVLVPKTATHNPSPAPKPPTKPARPQPPAQLPLDAIPLDSEKGVGYRKLRGLLKEGKWKEADEETLQVMLKAANRVSDRYLDTASLKNFPCKDLRTIDQLWVTASDGHFGFSVQKKIWEDCGSPTSSDKNWDRFCVKVGWQNDQATSYVSYSGLSFNLSLSPRGELPVVGGLVGGWFWEVWGEELMKNWNLYSFLAQRLGNCSTKQF